MKKLDKLGIAFNIILGIAYIPFSFFCWLSLMVSEMAIDATNPLYLHIVNLFCIVDFFIPLLCLIGIVLSVIFRAKGYSVLSFVIQFTPIMVFILNLILLYFTEFIPKVI